MPKKVASGNTKASSNKPSDSVLGQYTRDICHSLEQRRLALIYSAVVVLLAIIAAYSFQANVSEDDLERWRSDLTRRSERLGKDIAAWLDNNPTFQTHSKGDIGWMNTSPIFKELIAQTRNVTKDFQQLFQDLSLPMTALVPSDASELVFVLVPGLFTRWYPGYMAHNVKQFKSLGLDVRVAPLNTDVGVLMNAESLKRFTSSIVDETGKRVVLMAHSKGALDAAAMLAVYPETRGFVAALVAAQAPYGGATLVNDLMHTDTRKRASLSVVESLLAGNKSALEDLTYDARRKLLAEHEYPVQDIPTISLSASAEDMKFSLLKPAIDYVKFRYKQPNDGCVSVQDAFIPGGFIVYVSDMDHFGPAYHGFPALDSYDPSRMFLVLYRLATLRADSA